MMKKAFCAFLCMILLCSCSESSETVNNASVSKTPDISEQIDSLAAQQEEEYLAGKAEEEAAAEAEKENAEPVESNVRIVPYTGEPDIDLTEMSSTMIYSEVLRMMMNPEEYEGKTIRIFGAYTFFHDTEHDQYFYACIVKDATQCCAQGLEFALNEEYVYPDDYPEEGDEITVTGVFHVVTEGNFKVMRLYDGVIESHTPLANA